MPRIATVEDFRASPRDEATYWAAITHICNAREGRRVMAYAQLQEYSNLKWYLERVPPRSAETIDALADEWWASTSAA